MTTASEPAAGVDLAQEPDFRLGGLLVSPSTGRVRSAQGEQRVEPRVMQVLTVLVREAGRTVTRDRLIDACWGGRIVSDDAVNRVLAQVRGLARSLDPPPFVLDTVPKVGVRLVAGDDGAGDAGAGDAGAASGGRRGRRLRARYLVLAAAALALAAAGAAITWRLASPDATPPPEQNGRVDVMAFTPQDGDPALPKVAADLSESIVRTLSAGGVEVTDRPVARDAAASTAELRVAGTVERDARGYAFNAQILDRKSGGVLWTERLVRTTREQEAAPSNVADTIAAVLHCALEDRKRAHARLSTEGFSLYLQACAGVFVGYDSWGRMLAVTRRLVKVAPRFAGAHAMHSIAAANAAGEMNHSPAEAAALHAEATAAARRALELDPDTPKAYSGLALNLGVLSDRMSQNRVLVEQYLLKALKLDPDLPPARHEYSNLLRATGRVNETIEFVRASSAAQDPRGGYDPRFAMLLASNGDIRGAYEALDRMEITSRASQNSVRLAIAFWWEDPKTALPRLRALSDADTPPADLNCMETYLREIDARRAAKTRGLPKACDGMEAHWRARMLAREGDLDGAFALLQGPIPGGPVLLYYPEMAGVRRDPRFWPLVARFGLTDYWLKSGHWPDFCTEPGLPYDCKTAARAANAARPRARAR